MKKSDLEEFSNKQEQLEQEDWKINQLKEYNKELDDKAILRIETVKEKGATFIEGIKNIKTAQDGLKKELEATKALLELQEKETLIDQSLVELKKLTDVTNKYLKEAEKAYKIICEEEAGFNIPQDLMYYEKEENLLGYEEKPEAVDEKLSKINTSFNEVEKAVRNLLYDLQETKDTKKQTPLRYAFEQARKKGAFESQNENNLFHMDIGGIPEEPVFHMDMGGISEEPSSKLPKILDAFQHYDLSVGELDKQRFLSYAEPLDKIKRKTSWPDLHKTFHNNHVIMGGSEVTKGAITIPFTPQQKSDWNELEPETPLEQYKQPDQNILDPVITGDSKQNDEKTKVGAITITKTLQHSQSLPMINKTLPWKKHLKQKKQSTQEISLNKPIQEQKQWKVDVKQNQSTNGKNQDFIPGGF